MKRFLSLFLLMIFVMSARQAFAWGNKGHDIIAHIAQCNLTPKAKENLASILGGKSLVYYSSWLDNVQNSPYWENGYDRTKTWHYFNIDEGYTIQTMKKEPKGDVLQAVNMLIDSLGNHNEELNDSVRLDYVRMLIHLVGDLHCPMHAGHLSDYGGNKFYVKWFKSNTNLHKIWDSRLIESLHSWSYTEWQQNIDDYSQEQIATITAGTPEDWFSETVNIATQVYAYAKPEQNYSYQYMYDYHDVVERQLLAAGYRLAFVLNKIFG